MILFNSSAVAPLEGIRVLDLSRFVCGNMVSLLLADFGADVVKIEDPERGDPLRHLLDNGLSLHWKIYGRNKRSLTLDIRRDEGKAVLLDLVKNADVLVESFRAGTLEKMRLGPDELRARNPKLIIVRISGFGQTGAYREKPGFGTLVEAMSGFATKNGDPDRPPTLPNMALADMVAGVYGAFATVVAVRDQEKSGRGQVIDLSLLEPLISMLGPDPAIYALTGKVAERTGSRSSAVAPRNIYRTNDGLYIALSASTQSMTERMFAAIGLPNLITDKRFHKNADRIKHVEELDAIIGAWISERSRDECLAHLGAAEVTAGPVYNTQELVDDPHVKSREALVSVPDWQVGAILMHNITPRFSETPGAFRRAAPELGRDTEAVLREAGYDTTQFLQLLKKGIVTASVDSND